MYIHYLHHIHPPTGANISPHQSPPLPQRTCSALLFSDFVEEETNTKDKKDKKERKVWHFC
jgi:hypothetical protein